MKIFMKSLTTFLQVIPELPDNWRCPLFRISVDILSKYKFWRESLDFGDESNSMRLLNSVFFNKILFYFHHI